MRLISTDIALLQAVVSQVAPDANAIRLFGSRIDDQAKGGDIDLMIDFNHLIERPALLSTLFSVSISRALQGWAFDVILRAPNVLEGPIHKVAEREGILL